MIEQSLIPHKEQVVCNGLVDVGNFDCTGGLEIDYTILVELVPGQESQYKNMVFWRSLYIDLVSTDIFIDEDAAITERLLL